MQSHTILVPLDSTVSINFFNDLLCMGTGVPFTELVDTGIAGQSATPLDRPLATTIS